MEFTLRCHQTWPLGNPCTKWRSRQVGESVANRGWTGPTCVPLGQKLPEVQTWNFHSQNMWTRVKATTWASQSWSLFKSYTFLFWFNCSPFEIIFSYGPFIQLHFPVSTIDIGKLWDAKSLMNFCWNSQPALATLRNHDWHYQPGFIKGYPPVNQHRPWQIGVGRLVSTKNWWFSGSMLIYQRLNPIVCSNLPRLVDSHVYSRTGFVVSLWFQTWRSFLEQPFQ